MKLFFLILWLSLQAHAQSVKSIAPDAQIIPSNTLRFYFTFANPSRGLVHQGDIKLVDSRDRPIENAFMDFGQELWSPDGKRLTVLFDPGKIKRGVEAANSELAPLKDRESYKITLGKFQHAFRVSTAVREKVNPAAWVVLTARGAIDIKFDRVMDTALLEDQLEVQDENGRPVSGVMRATGGGSGAIFTSSRPMRKGTYQIKISPIFEDVAGNRMSDALDHSVSEKPDERSALIIKTIVR